MALRTIVERDDVQEALFVASPDLYRSLDVWRSDPESTRGRRTTRTLLRYVTRMAMRATPFGMFAAASHGAIGEGQSARVVSGSRRRHVRVDMGYLESLAASLAGEGPVRAHVTYTVNETVRRFGARYRYVEAERASGTRNYRLAAVDATPEVAVVIEAAQPGASVQQLSLALVQHGVDPDDAEAFVLELIEAGVLRGQLEPRVTGGDQLGELIALVHDSTRDRAEALRAVDAQIATLNAMPLGASIQQYESIEQEMTSLMGAVRPPHTLQVDSSVTVDGALPAPVRAAFQQAAEVLARLGGQSVNPLADFASRFVDRYERESVPLLEALDPETGVAFWESGPSAAHERAMAQQQASMASLVARWAAHGDRELLLSDSDLDAVRYSIPAAHAPGSAIVGNIVAASPEAVEAGDFTLAIAGAFAPSGALWFGRFCHTSAEFCAAVQAQLALEEQAAPDRIHAELVHLPTGRLGNVLVRPVLRHFEIPFLGRSGAPQSAQLALDDLVVCVRGGHVILRSVRHDAEVMPCLTSAHNVSSGPALALYRFLARLREQDAPPALGWNWGALSQFDRLPRVRYGNLVLARAQWRLSAERFRAVFLANAEGRSARIAAWRAAASAPRFVSIADGDNVLCIDLTNELSVDMLCDVVPETSPVVLTETYPDPTECGVWDTNGQSFAHEIVVPFVHQRASDTQQPHAVQPAPAAPVGTRIAPSQRTFLPGSEWLYAKFYGGPALADRFLREHVGPLIDGLRGLGVVDQWFFLRYADPLPHVRVRLHGPPNLLLRHAMPMLHDMADAAYSEGLVSRMQLDTYVREIERYGGVRGTQLAESIFHADSTAVLDVLSATQGGTAFQRGVVALMGVDGLFAALGMSMAERLAQTERVPQTDTATRRYRSDVYRVNRTAIESALLGRPEDLIYTKAAEILHRRNDSIHATARTFEFELGAQAWASLRADVAMSYTHMFVNRVLAEDQNRIEPELYDSLGRFYTSQRARTRTPSVRVDVREHTAVSA